LKKFPNGLFEPSSQSSFPATIAAAIGFRGFFVVFMSDSLRSVLPKAPLTALKAALAGVDSFLVFWNRWEELQLPNSTSTTLMSAVRFLGADLPFESLPDLLATLLSLWAVDEGRFRHSGTWRSRHFPFWFLTDCGTKVVFGDFATFFAVWRGFSGVLTGLKVGFWGSGTS
jgi:hypothetical protein